MGPEPILFGALFAEHQQFGKDIVQDDHNDADHYGCDIEINVQQVDDHEIEKHLDCERSEAGGDKACSLFENIRVCAAENPLAVRRIGKGYARNELHNGQDGRLYRKRMRRPGVKNNILQKPDCPCKYGGHPTDDQINQYFAMLDAQFLDLVHYPRYSSMIYLGLPLTSS